MKYVTQVMHDLGISFDDIVKIFVDSGYTEEDADEFCCNKWSDVKDMLLFEDEECFVKLAKLFRLDRDEYKWQESNKSSKRKMSESSTDNDSSQIELQSGTLYIKEKDDGHIEYILDLDKQSGHGKVLRVYHNGPGLDYFELAKEFTGQLNSSYLNRRDLFLDALDCIAEILEI